MKINVKKNIETIYLNGRISLEKGIQEVSEGLLNHLVENHSSSVSSVGDQTVDAPVEEVVETPVEEATDTVNESN